MASQPLLQRPNLHLSRRGNIFILTLQKPPENRLTVAFCQDIIASFHYIQSLLGPLSSGAVITRGSDEKFFCTGVDLEEGDSNPFANSDGFYPMLASILDFPYPTVALLTGHTFGGACPFALAHDYRVMNSKRGFIQMVRNSFGIPISCLCCMARNATMLTKAHPATSKSRPSLPRHGHSPTPETFPKGSSKNATRSAQMDGGTSTC